MQPGAPESWGPLVLGGLDLGVLFGTSPEDQKEEEEEWKAQRRMKKE